MLYLRKRAWADYTPLAVILALLTGAPEAHGQRLKTSTHVFATSPDAEKLAEELDQVAAEVVSQQPDHELVDITQVLAPTAVKENEARIFYARKSLTEGKQAYENLDLEAAIQKFQESADFFEQAMAYVPPGAEYAEVMTFLGAIAAMQGDPDKGKANFRRVLAVNPSMTLDPNLFPQLITDMFDETRNEMGTVQPGSVRINTFPPAGKVFIDGQYVGVAEIAIPGVPAGKHVAVAEKKGYVAKAQAIEVVAGTETTATLTMTQSSNYHVYQTNLTKARNELATGKVGQGISELGRWLYLNRLLLGQVEYRAAAQQIEVRAALYDIDNRQQVNAATQVFALNDPGLRQNLSLFLAGLFAAPQGGVGAAVGVIPGGETAKLSELEQQAAAAQQHQESEAEKKKQPIYKKWWFWTAIGAAVVTTVVVVVVATGGSEPAKPGPPPDTGQIVLNF